jgi:hypothetical protein
VIALAALTVLAAGASAGAAAPDPPRTKPESALEQRRQQAQPGGRDAPKRPGDEGVAPVLIVVALVAAGAGLAWLTMSTGPAVLVESTNAKGAPAMTRFKRRPEEDGTAPPAEGDLSEPDAAPLKGRLDAYSAAPQLRDLGDEAADDAPPTEVPDATGPRRSATAEIGPRVAEVLQAAEAAAEEIVADARREAEEVRGAAAQALEQATVESEQLRLDADSYAGSTRAQADEQAELLRREAHEEVEALRAEAEADARVLREDGEAVREQLAREGLERQRQLATATHALEERLGTALAAVQGIASELDELLAKEREATAEDESLVEALSSNRRRRQR